MIKGVSLKDALRGSFREYFHAAVQWSVSTEGMNSITVGFINIRSGNDSGLVSGIVVKYTFSIDNGNSTAMSHNLRTAVLTGRMTTLLNSEFPNAVCDIVPQVSETPFPWASPSIEPSSVPSLVPTVLPTVSPSGVPSIVPTVLPTVSPSGVPSVVPTVLPTVSPSAVPSTDFSIQFSGSPTTLLLLVNSSQTISFNGTCTLSGVNSLILNSSTATAGFKHSIAKSMSGVRPSDVSVMNLEFTVARRHLSGVISHRTDEIDTAVDDGVKSGTNRKTLNTPIYNGFAIISWNVTVIIGKLKAASASAAYLSLISQLNNAFSSGSFISLLYPTSPAYASITTAAFHASAYTLSPALIPTANPTAAPVVASPLPWISYLLAADISRSSVTVTVNLLRTGSAAADGYALYCIALANGSVPSTIGGIKSAAADASTSVGASTVIPIASSYPLQINVTLDRLAALTTYALFCYVESYAGEGTSLASVRSRKIVVTTPCCKDLTFTNLPSSVYGEASKYIGSSSS